MDRPVKSCSSPSCNLNDLFISCEGICRQRFHAFCVGLSTAEVPVISASRYFFWFCDVCRNHIQSGRTTIAVRSVPGIPAEEKACWSTECIFTDQLIRCDGPCGQDFHGMCVKLAKADLAVIGSSVNIVWFCEACKSDVLPVLDGSGGEPTKEAEQRDVEEVASDKVVKPAVESSKLNDESSTENDERDLSSTEEGEVSTTENDGNSTMQDIPDAPAGVESPVVDTTKDHRSPNSSSNMVGNSNDSGVELGSTKEKIPEPAVRTSTPKVFTFGKSTQPSPSRETSNFSFANPKEIAEKFKEIRENLAEQNKRLTSLKLKIETDENSNAPAPKKLLLATGSAVNTSAPATKSKFSLFVRFSVPNMSDSEAEQAVRDALGMSRRDPVTAWSVTPHHVLFPRFSTFRVDVDARWKLAALCSSSWGATDNLLEHREWFEHKL